MAEGSILYRTSTFEIEDDITYDIPLQAETKLGPGTLDFWSSGTNLVVPSSLDGTPIELFFFVEEDQLITSTDDAYIGVIPTGAGSNSLPEWYGIVRDVGKLSRGCRSGPFDPGATSAYLLRLRTFGSGHGTILPGIRCHIGVLVGNPVPIGLVIKEDTSISCPNGSTILSGALGHNLGDVGYSSGVVTVPAGAEAMVVSVNTNSDPFEGSDRYVSLDRDDGGGWTEMASFMHGASGRTPGPGCFGLNAVTPGEQWRIRILNNGSTISLQNSFSFEFY